MTGTAEIAPDRARRLVTAAHVSPCGRYRYSLVRTWDDELPAATWCMLNPSTADSETDDATIRRCIGFAQRWRMGGIRVVNLFAFRSRWPSDVRAAADPVGAENRLALELAFYHGPVICAWGSHFAGWERLRFQIRLVKRLVMHTSHEHSCLGLTKLGQPRHPLMLAYSTPREPWP